MDALSLRGLTKRYGRIEALHGVDLTLPRGEIYGLVGLNGAGKTTTIECALGLQRFDGGQATILGLPPSEIHRSGGRITAALDAPALHPHLTVRQELEHGWILCGRGGRSPREIEPLLGLESLASRRTRELSLGNRRRLSVALALLGSPELAMLDEPFSGLDAAGVEELIALVRRLVREEGTTFLFSSHQLDLVERAATRLGIIHEGRMLREGSLVEVLDGGAERIRIDVGDAARALEVLRAKFPGLDAARSPDGALAVSAAGFKAAEMNAELVRAGIAVSALGIERPSLASAFRRVTGFEAE